MFNKPASFFLGLLAVVHAAPTPSNHVVHERRDILSPAWVKRDRLSGERTIPMRIGLTQAELENAEYHLMSVSHPDSPDYGNHWNREEIIEMFRPSQDAESQVREWLINHGIDSERIAQSVDKAWFMFYVQVDEAEALLATEFHEYEHFETGTLVPSCEQYHVPIHVSPHIDYITPGIHLPLPGKLKRSMRVDAPEVRSPHHQRDVPDPSPRYNKSDLSHCDNQITPNCISAFYDIPPTSGSPHPNNSLGIYEGNLQFWIQSDLDTFFTNYTDGAIPNGTHPIEVNIDGGQQSADSIYYAGDEVNVDLQLAYPIVYPQTIVEYNVDDLVYQTGLVPPLTTNGFDTFLDALDGSFCNFTAYNQTGDGPADPIYPDPNAGGWQGDLECGTQTATNVISISYGGAEQDVYLSYQKRQCLEFLKLGLQGVSIIISSGDWGTANTPAEITSYGTPGCMGSNNDIFQPTWPSNCPWVTSVGGTRFYPGQTVNDSESAWSQLPRGSNPLSPSSSGGFSNVYTMPDYQKSAVATFFQDHDPGYPYYSMVALNTSNVTQELDPDYLQGGTGGIYNRIGRGIPDVSANGYGAVLFAGGEWFRLSGTSLSAPIFASIINRINEERLSAGKNALGFLNPSLYANPSMLNDITNGTNFGCNGTEVGFNATEGWDPVTGLGTPNFPKMLEYYMSLS